MPKIFLWDVLRGTTSIMGRRSLAGAEFNGVAWSPISQVRYCHDYGKIWRVIQEDPQSERRLLRELILSDLFFVVNFILRIPRSNHPFIVDACRDVQEGPRSHTLDVWAREHFKTSILSVAEGIQRVLNDRELTVGIFSNARRPAESIMRSIKRVMEESDVLKWCFPDVLWADPVKESPLWSDDKGLVVKRSGYQKESTFECWGLIDGMPTGPHFKHRIYDDVVTAAVVPPQGSPETMEKVKENFDLSENLGAEGGTCRVIGTFYHHEDPLVYIQNKRKPDGSSVFTVRKKPATIDGTFNGPSVFLSDERLDILRTNRRTFACQQLLDPTPQEMMSLDPEMLTCVSSNQLPQRLFKFMVVDFAGQGTKKKDDAWAIHVIGVNPWVTDIAGSDLYILDTCIRPMSMDEAMRQIVLMYTRNGQIWEVGVEKVSATTMEVHVENALKSQGKRGAVVKVLQPKGRRKESRITQALEWPLGNNKIKYLDTCDHDSVIRLKDEMKRFPYWHDDGIDALSYIYDLLVDFPFAKKRIQQNEEDLYKRSNRWKDLDPKMKNDNPWYYV